MSSCRNREAGHNYERTFAKRLRDIGYSDVRTSRECSRTRDAKKVDVCNSDEDESGRLPYNFQLKNLSKAAPYPKLLAELEEHNGRKQINVVGHKATSKVGTRFMPAGEFAILHMDDFLGIMERLLNYEEALVKSGCDLEFMDKIINSQLICK